MEVRMKTCFLDFETSIPKGSYISKQGGHRFLEDAEPYLLAYAIDDGPVRVVTLEDGLPDEVLYADLFVAHNAGFDRACSMRLKEYRPAAPWDRWYCTAAIARSNGYPGGLDKLAQQLFAEGKDKEGGKAMKALGQRFAEHGYDGLGDEELEAVRDYAARDVELCRKAFNALPPMSEKERALWMVDMKVNARGLYVDVLGAEKLRKQEEAYKDGADARVRELTGGEATKLTQTVRLAKWAEERGVSLRRTPKGAPSMGKDDVRLMLAEEGLPKDVREVFELRLKHGGIAGAKAKAILAKVCWDYRIRDEYVFNKAISGRWAGSGVQVQNLGRGSEVRNLIVAPRGKHLAVSDLNQIEARTTAWLAGDNDLLEDFANGTATPYEDFAKVIWRLDDEAEVTKEQRQIAKAASLGCGYGLGKAKMLDYLGTWGLKTTAAFAERIVSAYRDAHPKIVRLREDLQATALRAVDDDRGGWENVGLLSLGMGGDALVMRLPSGRCIRYREAEIHEGPYGWELKYSDPIRGKRFLAGHAMQAHACSGTARDVLGEAMVRIDEAGYDLVGHVHDEVICEVEGWHEGRKVQRLMEVQPDWAEGLPIDADFALVEKYGDAK